MRLIISLKGRGATYYGIGSALAAITKVILQDERSVLTICSPSAKIADVENVTVAMPLLFGGDGVIQSLPLAMNDNEREKLHRSALIVRQAIDSLDEQESSTSNNT